MESRLKITGQVKLIFHNVNTGQDEVLEVSNTFVTTGKNSLAARLAGSDTPANTKGAVTYMAVGTGTAVPGAGDVKLQTENTRKQVSQRDFSGNVATFTTFFNTSEANANLREVGLFGDDASDTTDSGTLFARAAISKNKNSSETLTIEWTLTVN